MMDTDTDTSRDPKAIARAFFDPRGTGTIPRRVVVVDGLVTDQTLVGKTHQEIHAMSQLAHELFGTEPRDPSALLRRCLDDDSPASWTAMRDDLVLGHAIPMTRDDAVRALRKPYVSPEKTFACVKAAASAGSFSSETAAAAAAAWPADILRIVAESLSPCDDDDLTNDLADEFDEVPTETVRECLLRYPHTAALFVRRRDLRAVCTPEIVRVLEARGESPPASAWILATLCREGVAVDPAVGDDILRKRRASYDVRTLAAAAVISRPVHPGISEAIETVCAALQRVNTATTTTP